MRKLLLVTVAALVWAAPAGAKELLGAQLCGPGGCVTERSATLLEGPNGPFSGELVAPAKPGPWFRGYLLAGDNGKVMGKLPFYYVPGQNQLVQPGRNGQTTTWTHPTGKLVPMLERLAKQVTPYKSPRFTAVRLDSKPVEDPQSYVRIWTVGSAAHGYPADGIGSRLVVFYTASPTPWSDGNYIVAYPKSRLLTRDGQLVAIPKDVANGIARGTSLAPRSSRPWLWALAIVPVAALAGIRPLRRRRR